MSQWLLGSTAMSETSVESLENGESDALLYSEKLPPSPTVRTHFRARRWCRPLAAVLLLVGALAAVYSLRRSSSDTSELREYAALRRACDENDWREGLYVNATLQMGLNNLRSEFATVLKWAFDAGAGIVLPRIVLRDNATLDAWPSDSRPFISADHYFNTESLRQSLAQWCPQMAIREALDWEHVAAEPSDRHRGWRELKFEKGTYRRHLDGILAKHHIQKWSSNANVLVRETLTPYTAWDYRNSSIEVNNAWFDLLEWAPRLDVLARAVGQSHKLREGYLAVHLRTERDVLHYWPDFDKQVDAYSFWIQQRPERTIFLACGDSKYESKFQQRFPEHRIVTKWTLADDRPKLMAQLNALTFDEMAAIDYEVARKSNLVLGIGQSSFAYLLGVDRRQNRAMHFSEWLHDELLSDELRGRTTMVGDDRTKLLPPILDEYYESIP